MAFRSTWSPNFDSLIRAGNQGIAYSNSTLAVWARLDNTAASYEAIEINNSNGTAFFTSAITVFSNNWAFHSTNSAGTRVSYNGTAAATNTWVHLAVTFDGTNMVSYINGAQVDSRAGPAGPFGNWADVQVGPALGYLQDAVFYTRALSALEIQQLYARRMPPSTLNLRHWLPIFPGSGRLKDFSGNGLDFTNNGTPTDPGSTIPLPLVGWGGSHARLVRPGVTNVSFSGSVTSPTAATGSIAIKNQFSGAAASTSACAGTLQVRKLFTSGLATSPSAATGTAQAQIRFTAGTCTSPTACTATLQSRQVFSGACSSPSACTGTLQLLGTVAFAGTATSPTACTATLNVRKLATSCVATSPTACTGTLAVKQNFAGTALSPTACAGTLRVRKFFSALALSPTAVTGVQTGGTVVNPPSGENPYITQKRRAIALYQFHRRGRM